MANPTIIGGIFLLLSTLRTSFGFSFNTSTPTQCGPLTVQWDGGRPPFQLLIVPTFEIASGKIVNFTIPDSLSAPYSYTFDLEEPAGLEFLVTMYDSEGFGTGGTTGVLTVGSSDNTSCLDTNLLYDFTFQLSPVSDPPQCSSQTITWPNNVTRPINLFGLIPGGTAWQIPIPQDGTSYDWQVNIDDGTEYLLVMSDTGPYITGGSSNLIRVASGSEGCMNSTSPRAGSAGSTPTTSGSNPSSSVSGVGGSSNGGQANENTGTTGQSNGGGGSSTPIGAIVGGTVGGVAFIVLLLLLLFCFCRRRARPRRDSADPMIKSYGVNGEPVIEKRRSGMVDLLTGNRPQRQFSDDSQNNETREGGQEYQPSPFTYPDSTQTAAMTGATAARPGGRPGESAAIAGAGTGVGALGALGAAGQRRNLTGEKEQLPPSLAADTHTRQSTDTQSTQPTTPINPHSNLAPSEISTSNDNGTDMATLGHVGQGQGVNRNSSISKPAHTSTPNDGTRPLPNAPAAGGQRFVQHEDSGEVVDLPPRYDQLRTRNPDP